MNSKMNSKQSLKKCLVLDLDDTLWGGLIMNGLESIELSESGEGGDFKNFQRKIKAMKDAGVVLAICSKNDAYYTLEVFEHRHMVLQEDDFSAKKINWEAKSVNIKAISSNLDISLDSIVFIDNSPSERREVKQALPEIVVPPFPDDTSDLEYFITEIHHKYFTEQRKVD